MPPAPVFRSAGFLSYLAAGFVFLAGCLSESEHRSSDSTMSRPPNEALVLASAKVLLPPRGPLPDDLPESRSNGAYLLVTYCTACHPLPSPASHSATDWPGVVRRMWLRAEGIGPAYLVPIPTPSDRVTLVQYLIRNALDVSRTTIPEGPNRADFAAGCSRCHELPDPRQHTSDDWAAVVERMARHSAQIPGRGLSAADVEAIEAYLRTAAARR